MRFEQIGVLQIGRREIHAKALGFFVDLDRLRDDLKAAQQSELDALEPKRVELQAVDDFIKQSENEIEEIATALRKARAKGRPYRRNRTGQTSGTRNTSRDATNCWQN